MHAAGAQFTGFTGTKVQILTQLSQLVVPRALEERDLVICEMKRALATVKASLAERDDIIHELKGSLMEQLLDMKATVKAI